MRCPTCGHSLGLPQIAYRAIQSGASEIATIRSWVRREVKATDKEIANALAKLVRSKRAAHLGYGIYAPADSYAARR